ncbi:MAG: Holliday junction branch migration protein RuvA [Acidimicrobiia bacterium]|nr:Holliday junction branch migration protein RuvA [Acidimicrobiia bacterium]
MIGRLRGVVALKHADRVLLDVAGVGYEIAVPPRALVELPGIGEEAVVHTHLHVREDAMALFGFAGEDQRDLFRVLLGVSGVGPKVALAILGTMSPDDLRRAVLTEDAAALTAVPGIGKRSAQKLMLELRPKLELPDTDLAPSHSPLSEVRAALEGLGYQSEEIRGAMADLPDTEEVESLLRHALQVLGKS